MSSSRALMTTADSRQQIADNGQQTDAWINIDKQVDRQDPRAVLPGCRLTV
jgi:hypothetical protein